VNNDGTRLALTKGHYRTDVYLADLKENGTSLGSARRLTFSDSLSFPVAWARDSKAILVESNRTGKFQIFTQQLESDTPQLLTQGPDDARGAELTPDGAWVLYLAMAHGGGSPPSTRLMRSPGTGGGPQEQVLEIPYDAAAALDCPSHPGSSCIFGRSEQDYVVFYALDPSRGLGKEVARNQGVTGPWSISPDGTRLALRIPKAVRILDLRSGQHRDLKFLWRVGSLSWAVDGKALFAAAQSTEYLLVRLDLDGKTHVLLNRGRNHYLSDPWPSPDGRYLAFAERSWDSNIWLIENF
jgi:Tol biopolymer transport system component